jgi:UDP:flavonoid glycosyltransferase YjiC (YdhE family)
VHLARYLPQTDLLPWCDAVLSHAGSGSVLGAITHALPQVLVPMGADQLDNGDRCAALGLARVLDPVGATPDEIGAAAHEVLTAPSYREAARELRDEALALPGPEHAVTLLETLARTGEPVLA